MSDGKKIIGKYIPLSAAIVIAVALGCAVLLLLSSLYTPLADLLSASVGALFRFTLGALTSLFPFSIFECLCILALPLIVLAIVLALTSRADTAARVRTVFILIAVISSVFISYVFTLGVGFHTTTLEHRLGLDTENIEREELLATASELVGEVNSLADKLGLRGVSELGYGDGELSRRLSDSYSALAEELGFFKSIPTRVKPIRLSGIMSDAGITGIYSFFTGEANYNTAYPDYCTPYTVAHELAHQRGFSREDEANFMAYLVCISSPDDYIRYSGYLNLLEYLLGAVYRTDEDEYREIYSSLHPAARADIAAAREVSRAHADTLLGKISDSANDAYLKLNGTEGVVSYNLVVRLAVAYHTAR
ncbi:MAG: DUF3810 domain-containing protein [Clostridia bacterium]|nr:DUF3810 domain-containing protein [Clostridia bacterium]